VDSGDEGPAADGDAGDVVETGELGDLADMTGSRLIQMTGELTQARRHLVMKQLHALNE